MPRSLHALLVLRTALVAAIVIGAAIAAAAFLGSGRPLALFVLLAACTAILAAASAWMLGRRVVAPLRTFALRGQLWLHGGAATLPIAGLDELDAIAATMNGLRDRLTTAEGRLALSHASESIDRFAAGAAASIDDALAAITAALGAPAGVGRSALEPELLRLERLARGLRDYARPAAHGEPPADINDVVRRTIDLLTSRGPLRRASLSIRLAADAPLVCVARHELELLCMNLLLNAAEACEETGAVSVSTTTMPLETLEHGPPRRVGDPPLTEMHRQPHPRLRRWLDAGHRPGDVVKLVIADSGRGVAAADEERVFEPFVQGPGSAGPGLGLAVVARIAAHAGGLAWVQHAREGGAAFHVVLPVAGPNGT